MESDEDLETLMVRYQDGDTAAAAALVKRLSPRLHGFFRIQSVSRRHADDLLQETWMRIHQVRHTYRPGERLLPWLYAIARHVGVDHYRRARRVESRELQVETLPERAPAAGPSQTRPDIAALLAALPDGQREVITMLKISGMSLEDVARATSSSVGSVKQKAHRAYARLRESLAGMGFRAAGSGGCDER
jgi:RNA polymerase sigma-70 factor (ECF subfamily)